MANPTGTQTQSALDTAIEEKRQQVLERPALTDLEAQKDQAKATITAAQKALNAQDTTLTYESSGDPDAVYINGDTANRAKDAIWSIRGQNKSPLEDHERFQRGEFSEKTLHFLNKKIMELAEKNGVATDRDSLQAEMVRLMTINDNPDLGTLNEQEQELNTLFVLKNFVDLAVNNRLSSGRYMGANTPMETPWVPTAPETDDDPDRFFNPLAYEALKTSREVSTTVLFSEGLYEDPEKYDAVLRAAEKLNIDTTANTVLNVNQVGAIAKEMMIYQAEKQWCLSHPGESFDKSDINNAIYDMKFTPHLDDLYFVEKGMGIPPELQAQYNEVLQSDEANILIADFEFAHKAALQVYRAQQFADEFGKVEALRDNNQSPTHYYNTGRLGRPGEAIIKTDYEQARDRNLLRLKDGIACEVPKQECLMDGDTCRSPFGGASAQHVTTDEKILANMEETCPPQDAMDGTCSPTRTLDSTASLQQ